MPGYRRQLHLTGSNLTSLNIHCALVGHGHIATPTERAAQRSLLTANRPAGRQAQARLSTAMEAPTMGSPEMPSTTVPSILPLGGGGGQYAAARPSQNQNERAVEISAVREAARPSQFLKLRHLL